MNDVDLSWAGFWLGHPGTLLPFHGFIEPYDVDDQDDAQFERSLGGTTRARVSRKRAPRSWNVDLPTLYPRDVKNLRALLTATLPPYQFVTPEAQASNVLTPEQSVLTDQALGLGGMWPIEGGDWTATVRLNPSAAFGNEAPVWVGPAPSPPTFTARPVTVSAYVATARAEGARVWLQWLDAAGAVIPGVFVAGNLVSGMDVLRRSTASGVPPAGAVACRIAVSYAEVLAEPQVTWAEGPSDWDVGAGASQVLVHGLSRTIYAAQPGQLLQDVSFTVQEVGP